MNFIIRKKTIEIVYVKIDKHSDKFVLFSIKHQQ